MRYYTAPLEGITGRPFRNTIHELYKSYGYKVDKYFTPFFMPHIKIQLDAKDYRELLPEHNYVDDGLYLVPQILTNDADDFLRMAKGMTELGYKEINLNVGCPSSTVVNKKRGAGFLADPDALDAFLDRIFTEADFKISVKTRLGKLETEEFYRLLEIYNRYPMEELILHPRTGKEKYGGEPHHDAFLYALEHSSNPLCYNGDIFKVKHQEILCAEIQDYERQIPSEEAISDCSSIMLGRGLLMNPALIRECQGGPAVTKDELYTYIQLLRENYMKASKKYRGRLLLNKSKEVWSFMKFLYIHSEDDMKRIKEMLSTKKLEDYMILERNFFLED